MSVGGAAAPVRRVCVFCGASDGVREEYVSAARELAAQLAALGVGVVYGAGGVGVMGALSAGMLAAGGDVIGVIPRDLVEREMARSDLQDLRVVESMHERKKLMHDLSEAFVVLPGGLGTFEEFFEVLTWAQLGLHSKPIVVIDVADYFSPLRDLLNHCVAAGFVSESDRSLVHIVGSVGDAVALLQTR